MSPGGHLVTTAAACALTAYASGSAALTAAVAAGGFFIDLDHAVDYVLFDRERDLRPSAFLRHFLEGRVRHTVLVLHSYELFALLAVIAWWTTTPLLSAYLMGGLMHLALDIVFNGRITPYSIGAFYSFTYRLVHRFDAVALLGVAHARQPARGFWRTFFEGSRPLDALPRVSARFVDSRVPDALD
jgi:hypothetical protein